MPYDVAVIGSGFSGLAAIWSAVKKGKSCVLIADGFGATQHFSGAFDIADPAFFNKKFDFSESVSTKDLMQKIESFDPRHPYALARQKNPKLIDDVITTAGSFFRDFNIPVVGGDAGVMTIANSGKPKFAAFSLKTCGLDYMTRPKRAVILDIVGLSDYPAALIKKNLGPYFERVEILTCQNFKINQRSALATAVSATAEKSARESFGEFLKNKVKAGDLVIMPPLLGLSDYIEEHAKLEAELGVTVIEMLSVLPSVAGLRVFRKVKAALNKMAVTQIKGRVTDFVAKDQTVQALHVQTPDGAETIQARDVILATGKFLGGGITRGERWRETIFDFDLAREENQAVVTQTVPELANFLKVGILTGDGFAPTSRDGRLVYNNVKACGHVLSGFDFTRERAGFGISLATGLSVLS